MQLNEKFVTKEITEKYRYVWKLRNTFVYNLNVKE